MLRRFTNILPVFLTFFFTELVHSLNQCHGQGTVVSIGDRNRSMYIWIAAGGKWCIARAVGEASKRPFSRAEEICLEEFFDGSLLQENLADDFKQSLASTQELNKRFYWTGFPECPTCSAFDNDDQEFSCVRSNEQCNFPLLYVCQYPLEDTTTAAKPTTTTTKTTTTTPKVTTTTTPTRKPTTTTTTTIKPTTTKTTILQSPTTITSTIQPSMTTTITVNPSTTKITIPQSPATTMNKTQSPTVTIAVSPTSLYNVSEDFHTTTKYPIYVKNAVLATSIACAIIGTLFLIAAMIVRWKGTSKVAAPRMKKVLVQRRNVKSILKTSETYP